jgi:uncharacterized membrane protein
VRNTSVAAALVAAALCVAAAASAGEISDTPVSDADVMAMMQKHCVMCHAKAPTHPGFDAPPKNVSLETIDEVKAWAVKIVEQVVLDRNMPVGLDSEMTEEERAALARWAAALK